MAALVADEHLHGTRTLWASHRLRRFPGHTWDVETATMANSLNHSAMVFLETKLKTLLTNNILPFLKIFKHLQDC